MRPEFRRGEGGDGRLADRCVDRGLGLIGLMLFVLYVLIKVQGELRLYHEDLDHRLEVAATHAGADYVRNLPEAA